jgi:hypothetical protein
LPCPDGVGLLLGLGFGVFDGLPEFGFCVFVGVGLGVGVGFVEGLPDPLGVGFVDGLPDPLGVGFVDGLPDPLGDGCVEGVPEAAGVGCVDGAVELLVVGLELGRTVPGSVAETPWWPAATGTGGGVGSGEADAIGADTITVPAATTPTVVWAAAVTAPCDAARNGVAPNQLSGPIASRSRGVDTASIALTTLGSNCVPAQSLSSRSAAARLIGLRYDRAAVITSNASATATMRAPRQIRSPASPSG